jgi:hypothetical protein
MSQLTIRGMVRLIQVEIRDQPDLQPDRAAELLNKLTALLGNLNEEIRVADSEFATVLLQHLDSDGEDLRPEMRARDTCGAFTSRMTT